LEDALVQANVKSPPMTDLDYAIQLMMTGQRDPEFAARVQAQGAKITEEIRRKHGTLNVANDLIRESRYEE
jgi:hypothetical protein